MDTHHIIELRASSQADRDGLHSSEVLSAYFDAEHARVFRRLLLRRLAMLGVIALAIEALARTTGRAMWITVAIIGATALAAAVVEWRAGKRWTVLRSQSKTTGLH